MKLFFQITFIVLSFQVFSQDLDGDIFGVGPGTNRDWIVKEVLSVDINGDGRNDAIVVTETAEGEIRTLRLFEADAHGVQVEIFASTTVVLGSLDGGVFGDPWSGMSYKNDSLFISYYGGSRWRWSSRYQFKIHEDEWKLIGFEGSSYDVFNPDTDYTETSCDFINGRKYVVEVVEGKRTEGWQDLEPAEPISLSKFDIQEYIW